MNRAERALLAAAVGHLLLSVIHGGAHGVIPVHVPGWQYGYAVLVILLAPGVGAALLLRGRSVAGARLLLLSGLAALAFEAAFHFLVTNPDHLSTVESGRPLFASTAAVTTVGDALLVAVSAWFLTGPTVSVPLAGSEPAEKRP